MVKVLKHPFSFHLLSWQESEREGKRGDEEKDSDLMKYEGLARNLQGKISDFFCAKGRNDLE